MKTIPEQLSDLQMLVVRLSSGEEFGSRYLARCLLCQGSILVPHSSLNSRDDVSRIHHDPSCLYGMLCKSTIWVAGSFDWDNPSEAATGFRFYPATAMSSAAKVMAHQVSSYESWTDEDGTVYPDGRRLFLVMDLPPSPEFTEAYEAEKLAGERRVAVAEWRREVKNMDRLRARALSVFKELNLDTDPDLDARMQERVSLSYPYPPKPEGVEVDE